jgi:ABC-type Fe2+-enterobactin transport system substrate-binding protein
VITNDEAAVLMLAAEGQFMLAIGRWEAPIKSLTEKGMLKLEYLNGGPQFTITDAGMVACGKYDEESTQQLALALGKTATALSQTRSLVEQAAQLLASAVKEASQATGDNPEIHLKQWLDIARKRVLNLLHG